jgi:hypothetical protein
MIALLSFALTGCASIINGRSQSVDFESAPSGADLTVGGLKATTPAKLTLTRKETYTATFTKADFPARTVTLEPRASWWLLGNVLFGGLIGFIIDAATGSGFTLEPSDVHMDMNSGEVTRVKQPQQAANRRPVSGPQPKSGSTNFGR